MEYAKLENGGLIYAPTNYSTEDGRTIINFNKDPQIMLEFGYKLVVRAEREPGKNYDSEWTETETEIHEVITEIPYDPQPDIDRRERDFENQFFLTSLGYVRRNVTMADGSHKDFLTDLLPSIAIATNQGLPVSVLTYDKPEDFSEEIYDWTQYQHSVTPTLQFVQECFARLGNDFLPTPVQPEEETPEEETPEEESEEVIE